MAAPSLKIAILGWGSLLWDDRPEFRDFYANLDGWEYDGPKLRLEFARVSSSRVGALTLVLVDEPLGALCTVAYALSRRKRLEDAVCDVRCREGTNLAGIGYCDLSKSDDLSRHDRVVMDAIRPWAEVKKLDAVVWTNLKNNFAKESNPKADFSIPAAVAHLQTLNRIGKSKAAEYVWRAPDFVKTPLRKALEAEPWFQPLPSAPSCEPSAPTSRGV